MYEIEPRGEYFAIEKNDWNIDQPSACGTNHFIFTWQGATFFQKKDLIDIINKNYVNNSKYIHHKWNIGKLESDSKFSIININDKKAMSYLNKADHPYPKSVSTIIKEYWSEHLQGKAH